MKNRTMNDRTKNRQPSLETQTNWAIVAIVAVALVGILSPLAFADNVGAPTSAAGGVSAPSSPSLSPAAGPLSGTSGSISGRSPSGTTYSEDYRPLQLQPGTGKFEGPNNGTTTPCVGSTGFGSSGGVPGHKC
jgi:hypothetical protein